MATRSNIAVKMNDGTFKKIYCHFDGYVSHNGVMLLEHYNSQERAEALVALGNISYLRPSIECPSGHSFDYPVAGYTVAYGRDRGEKKQEAQIIHKSNTNCLEVDEEYLYVWIDDAWYVKRSDKGPLVPLTDAVNAN